MKVHARYLVIGPRLYIGGTPVRNIHLIDPDREGTMCGRTPNYANTLTPRNRWRPITERSKCKAKILECSICTRFVTQYAVNPDTYECLD